MYVCIHTKKNILLKTDHLSDLKFNNFIAFQKVVRFTILNAEQSFKMNHFSNEFYAFHICHEEIRSSISINSNLKRSRV